PDLGALLRRIGTRHRLACASLRLNGASPRPVGAVLRPVGALPRPVGALLRPVGALLRPTQHQRHLVERLALPGGGADHCHQHQVVGGHPQRRPAPDPHGRGAGALVGIPALSGIHAARCSVSASRRTSGAARSVTTHPTSAGGGELGSSMLLTLEPSGPTGTRSGLLATLSKCSSRSPAAARAGPGRRWSRAAPPSPRRRCWPSASRSPLRPWAR